MPKPAYTSLPSTSHPTDSEDLEAIERGHRKAARERRRARRGTNPSLEMEAEKATERDAEKDALLRRDGEGDEIEETEETERAERDAEDSEEEEAPLGRQRGTISLDEIGSAKRSWMSQIKLSPNLRTISLLLLSLVSVLLLGLFFHPSSPLKPHLPSRPPTSPSELTTTTPTKSNGTHEFEKTVLLISLDGVRADYLTRGKTPHLLSISRKGLRAKYLEPVFPSLTFPNHWSLLTGLLPSAHGIVANDFYDTELSQEFVYTSPEKSWGAQWWGGEPIWSTAVKSGLRAAVLMWPGPPKMADGTSPTYWVPFADHFPHASKVAQIAAWLDLPTSSRPQLILAYAPEVDQQGHRTGPDSEKVDRELVGVDEFAKAVLEVIEERNLGDIVDVVFVSDHGMTDTHNERLVFLDDILGAEGFAGIERNEGWPSAGLRFRPSIDSAHMLSLLLNASSSAHGGFHVYTYETMPPQWGFTGNHRIAPIYVVPHVGWAISDRHDYHVTMGGDYRPKGNHGYDPSHPSMHAIFAAHGPFAENLKLRRRRKRELEQGAEEGQGEGEGEGEIEVVEGFKNLEVYGLVARLLGIPRELRKGGGGTGEVWERWLGAE